MESVRCELKLQILVVNVRKQRRKWQQEVNSDLWWINHHPPPDLLPAPIVCGLSSDCLLRSVVIITTKTDVCWHMLEVKDYFSSAKFKKWFGFYGLKHHANKAPHIFAQQPGLVSLDEMTGVTHLPALIVFVAAAARSGWSEASRRASRRPADRKANKNLKFISLELS